MQDKEISALQEELKETKVTLAGTRNEKDHLKERLEMVTTAFEKTNNKLHAQKTVFDTALEDEKQKLFNKVTLMN